MNLKSEIREGMTVVSPVEEICAGNSAEFEKVLCGMAEKGQIHLVLDLSDVGYIDSSGIGAIVRVHRAVKAKGGEIVLAACNANLVKIFKLINFQKYFRILPTVEEVFKAAGPAPS